MAQQDPQPEEAATRPAAAAAQFAGSYTQTSMYGRALAGRGQAGEKDLGPASDEQPATGSSGRPARKSRTGQNAAPDEPQPDLPSTLELSDDPALQRLIGQLDPVEEAMWRAEQPPGQEWGPEPPAPVVQPGQWTTATPETPDPAGPGADDSTEQAGDPELAADDPYLACLELDSAAAQERLQVGQVELPPIATPGPIIGPGPV
jgi:hypothetical protein